MTKLLKGEDAEADAIRLERTLPETRSNTEPLIEIISTRFASIYANGGSFVRRWPLEKGLPSPGDVGKIRGLRVRLCERSASRTSRIYRRRRQRDPAIGIGNHSLRDEFYLDTLKRPYCSINSDNLRRGPRSVTLVTFFSCLPIVPLLLSPHTCILALYSSPRSSSPLSSLRFSSLLFVCFSPFSWSPIRGGKYQRRSLIRDTVALR